MAAKKDQKTLSEKNIKTIFFSATVFIGVLLLVFAGYSIFHAQKTFARQYIGGVYVGGKNKDQLRNLLNDRTSFVLSSQFNLSFSQDNDLKNFSFAPSDIGLGYNIEKMVDLGWNFGRKKGIWGSFLDQVVSLFKDRKVSTEYTYNEESLNKKIAEIASVIDIPGQDYSLAYDGDKFALTDKKEGSRLNQAQIKSIVITQITNFSPTEIKITREKFLPQVSADSANKCLDDANKIIDGGDLALKFGDQSFTADKDTIASFLESEPNGTELKMAFNQERVALFVESIGKSIDVDPQISKLMFSSDQVTIAKKSEPGKKLKQPETITDIENALLSRITEKSTIDPMVIALKVEITEPEITDDKINSLQIVELIGQADTNFVGSPANRVHNIQTGANALNGTLLKPDETFSTLGRLGSIDAASGYLEELVIKEDRTTPEFGGGLCQVSSTLFRAALNAGMEIVERRNHKYRVSYYEPPVGMDATIYDPAPDFKFKNNYAGYVLIQSKIAGTKITFEFYGSKDSRIVEISTPEVFDFVDPGQPIEIESDTLPPGERTRIEKAHQGASAKFNYKVTRDGQVLQEKTFFSKYVPWPEKWLVGKQPATETPAPEATPVPTPAPAPATP